MKRIISAFLMTCVAINLSLAEEAAFRGVKLADAKGKQADASLIFSDNNKFPLTVGMGLWSQHATTSGDQNLYPLIVMGGLVTIAPLIILFLILQRYWRSGMLLGSIAN